MKKLEETYKKIKTDDKLKERIIAKASDADLSQDQACFSYSKTRGMFFNAKRLFTRQKITAAATAFVLILSLTLVLALQPWKKDDDNNANITGVLAPVQLSHSEIAELIKDVGGDSGWREDAIGKEDSPSAPNESDGDEANDYAETNVQHEGVDEGDIIKVDGGYIYTLSPLGLLIVSVNNKMSISYQESYENFFPDELYIFGNKLVVIGGEYSELMYDCHDIGVEPVPWYGYRTKTKIMIYDLSNRANVRLSNEYSISGYFNTGRLIDGKLIVSINYNINYYDESSYFPRINDEIVDAKYIHLYKSGCYQSYMMLLSLNLESYHLSFAAHFGLISTWWGSVDYFSKDNMYSFVNMYEYDYDSKGAYTWSTYSVIIKISLGSLKYVDSQKIEGTVSDRYWADEYGDNLRVASFVQISDSRHTKQYTNVFVLDSDLEIIGAISDIAPGERIYSVRFRGEQGSIVTFLEIDPLFKLDLSDPKNPAISRGLKEMGVSDYLQYLNDDYLLGLGRNTSTENGWTQFKGMKIALYDNTGEDAVNINTINIGLGYVYSDALFEPKAILNDTAKSMFSFPVTMQGSTYRSLEGQGLMVFEYNLNAARNEDKLIKKGFLTNVKQNITYGSWEDYYYDYFSYVKRGARIGNRIYTISDRYITSYDVDTLELVQRLELTVDPCYFTHKWNSCTTTKVNNCTENGEQIRHCQTCGKEQKYVLHAYGHSFNNWEIETMPTAGGGGTESRKCYTCQHKETRGLVNTVGVNGFVLVLNEEGTEYYVRTYKGSNTTVEIPASHNGKAVNAIHNSAFENSNIRSITIPNSIISIGSRAFFLNANLKTVVFEKDSQLKTIGNDAFYMCFELNNIQIPQKVISVGGYAFYGCRSLESITIPSAVASIGEYAFGSCAKLRSVFIGASVSSMASTAFSRNILLETLTVASDNPIFKSDGNCVIETSTNTLIIGCTKSVIPDYIERIGSYAFYDSGITSIVIPKNVEDIGHQAFAYCSKLTKLTFENDSALKTIGTYAFAYSRFITDMDIGKCVVSVGYWAFEGWMTSQCINVYGAEDEYAGMVKLGANWKAGCNAVIKYFE